MLQNNIIMVTYPHGDYGHHLFAMNGRNLFNIPNQKKKIATSYRFERNSLMTLLKSICLLQIISPQDTSKAKYGFGITGTMNIPKGEASKKQFMTANQFDAVFILIHFQYVYKS